MTRLWLSTRRLATVLAVSGAFLVFPAAQAASVVPADSYQPKVLAQHGFGDRQNSYAWAMAWFQGKLYVGTARNEWCVENATTEFYFPFEHFYTTQPFLNVHCTANEYDLNLRAEIWQYTPRTGMWRMVYRAPANIPNPRARGKFLPPDIAYRGMTVMRDSHGRQALFVSGVTADEYVPEIAARHPPRLLRTYDGKHFHDIGGPLIVKFTGPFPDHRAIGFRGLEVWRGQLYALASAALTGDGAVFKVSNPFGDKATFTRVTPLSMHVFELKPFSGDLYVGTGSYATGYGVYKTSDSSPPFRFKPVVTHGAGMGKIMVSVVSMHAFKGHLYVGAVSWYSWNHGLPGTELIRIGHRGSWELVTGSPRRVDGQMRYPISGLGPGFGNFFNSHIWRMVDQNGVLYAGTLDWSWLLQDSQKWSPQWSWLISSVLSHEYGFDLWASCDGVNWVAVTRTAFNASPYDFGDRGLVTGPQGFYIGSADQAFGTRIWHYDGPPVCGSPRAARRVGVAEAPADLLTDVQRNGTVVSWEHSDGAVKYRVQRAQYIDASLGVRPPLPTGPGNFPYEDAMPRPVAPGTAGSHRVQVPTLGTFQTVGVTTNTFFVDRDRNPAVRYVYRAVAETATGSTSAPSNFQVVPDPRPPATFSQIDRADPGSPAVSAIAQVHGHRNSLLADLARLSRTAANDNVRQLAYRLRRRLMYQNVAGGPVRGG